MRADLSLFDIDSIYVDEDSRFVVSLIVGYSRDDLKSCRLPSEKTIFGRQPRTPRDFALLAAAGALSLTQDDGASGTNWFVYDRRTGEMHNFEQGDFEEARIL